MTDSTGDKSQYLRALQWEGRNFLKEGRFQEASACFQLIYGVFEHKRDVPGEAHSLEIFADDIPLGLDEHTAERLLLYERAAKLFAAAHDPVSVATAQLHQAELHIVQRKYSLAEGELLHVLEAYRKAGYKRLQFTYDALGDVYRNKLELHKELQCRIDMIKSLEASQDSRKADYFYARLALSYSNLGMFAESFEQIKKSLDILQQSQHYEDFYGDLSLAIYDLNNMEHPERALAFLKKETTEVPPVNLSQRMDVYEAYGTSYRSLGQYAKAEENYLKALRLFKITSKSKLYYTSRAMIKKDFIHYNYIIASLFILEHKFKKASQYLNKINRLPLPDFSPNTFESVQHMQFLIDSASGHYLKAIRDFEIQKKINDSAFNAVKSRQIAEIHARYQNEKSEQAIHLLESRQKTQQVQLQKVEVQRNLTLAAIGMLLLAVSFGINTIFVTRRSHRDLQLKQYEINLQNSVLQKFIVEKDKLLGEKDWLLKEVHHRVKNNLQIVMSLLSSQAAFLKHSAALAAIRESQNRVQSIALIHQKLYMNTGLSSVDMSSYIADLVRYLQECYALESKTWSIIQDTEVLFLDVSQAVPLGLILNEGITNALKYAGRDRKASEITVSLRELEFNEVVLSISDKGPGFSRHIDLKNPGSLGLQMIDALARQLGAKLEIESREGVSLKIRFTRDLKNLLMDRTQTVK